MKHTLLVLVFLSLAVPGNAQTPTAAIKVDQVGYLPSAPKIAVVGHSSAKTFVLKRTLDGATVFEGKLSAPASDKDTGDVVEAADFSKIAAAGQYYLEVPGVGRSWAFAIGPDIYHHAFYLVMRGFYGQRCGMSVDMGTAFPAYKHPACHLNGEFHESSGKTGPRANIGGWHDAGDYGRYVVNSGISTGSLLWAYEMFPKNVGKMKLDIPETGNGSPDILNEARYNLEWMLKMQDDDGGVWHKQTSTHFSGFVMPQDDTLPSEVIGTGSAPFKSTCATADLAAVAAIAARVYIPFDKKFAEQNLAAAKRAWQWTEKNPNVTFKNPLGISTGEYGDNNCSDERLWASAELWRTTGDASYNQYFVANYNSFLGLLKKPDAESWKELAPMGLWTYAMASREGGDAKAVSQIKQMTAAAAKEVVAETAKNPYHVSLLTKDYVWGSNGVAANYGMQLLVANTFSPNPAFLNAALDNLHYLLGRNTFSLSWVTQLGANPYRHPHHRPSGADNVDEPWPGLLSGGPNAGRQDDVLKKLPADMPPAKVYVDEQASYASNEIAINWQAMLAFVLAGVQ
ncbi:MAG TPA: glycoside hydrolase family 9 protein [Terriglobales bacterium]|nr:glycoside hydrolase family 9 protein [Terriglobales bacterium]